MDSRIYRHVFGNFPRNRTISHNRIPCHNLTAPYILKDISKYFVFDEETEITKDPGVFPFYQDFSYETDVSTIFYPGSGVVDRASKLVVDKILWQKKLPLLLPKDHVKALNYLRKGYSGTIPEPNFTMEKYLKHIKNDPEPYFEGDYNWLYTGGNIAHFNMNHSDCLITANEVKGSTVLNFFRIDPDFKGFLRDNIKQGTYCLKKSDPVLQICCSYKLDDLIVVARQRKNITLVKCNYNNEVNNEWTHEIDWGILISSDLSYKCDLIATVDSLPEVNIFDTEVGQAVSVYKTNFNSKSWAQIMFSENSRNLYLASQYSLDMIDLRVASKVNPVYKPVSVTSDCEVICNVIKRNYVDNSLLIATTHNLIEVDVRNMKNIQRWTHLMTSPPQFGKSLYKNGEELIILQSENPDELVGIVNECAGDNFQFISKSNPRIIGTVKRDLHKAQRRGICTHPGAAERVDFSITGLEVIEAATDSGSEPCIFTVNGGGDVILNKLKRTAENENYEKVKNCESADDTLKGLRQFEDHCLNIYSAEMTADEIVDMSSLLEELENESSEEKNFSFKKKINWPLAEMYSPESLCYYKDFMAERILQVWNIEMKSFCDEDEKINEDLSEELGVCKVIEWMNVSKED